MFVATKLFHKAGEGSGGGGGGDQHNLGWYATPDALRTAHPTAENGDWAIVGSTDTVWVWDSDTNAWKDTDQKGQVESVNGQTGTVVLTASDVGAATTAQGAKADTAVQPGDLATVATTGAYSDLTGTPTIPTVGDGTITITQGGVTKGTFTTNQSGNTTIDVDAGGGSGLPDQTGQSGKFLTTDGTDASWSDKPLVNKATGRNSLALLGSASGQASVSIGYSTMSSGNSNFVAGVSAQIADSGHSNVVIGNGPYAMGNRNIVIGTSCSASNGCIQLSTNTSAFMSNSVSNTMKVANANGNYEMMSADGTIPTARLTKVNTTITLAAADWSSNTQTVTVNGVTSTSVVFVAPDPADTTDYVSAGILCTAQGTNSLTFTATTTPSTDIDVVVVAM